MRQLIRIHDTDPHHAVRHVFTHANMAHEASTDDWARDVEKAVKGGGFTFHDAVGDAPSSGYMVSVAKSTEQKVPVSELDSRRVADYMAIHQQELKDPSNFLGAWVNRGMVYLDVSRHVDDRDEALRLAKEHQQLAIYDLGSGQEIFTSDHLGSARTAGKPTFFHVTRQDLWPIIRREGLKPFFASAGGSPLVWLFTDVGHAIHYADQFSAETVPGCIVVVRTDLARPHDGGIPGAYVSKVPIPASDIYDVIRQADFSFYESERQAWSDRQRGPFSKQV